MINIETGIKAFGKTYLYKSIFDNCGFGIIVNGYIQRIENNTFLNCRTCISGSGGGVNIEKNIFTNFTNYAIQYNLKGIRSVINSNQFNCNGILPMPFNSTKTAKAAIFLYSYFYSNPPLSAPNNLMISDNYITNCKDGIVLNNLKANSVNSINNVILPAIWSNFIWLQTPFVNLGITTNSAIKVLNCRNIGTAQNSISRGSTNETRNGLELQSIRGISYEFSTQTIWVNRNNTRYIWKNFLENINNSVIFKGSCLGVGVQCNTFFDPYYGVTIGGANEIADISNQLPYPLTYPNLTATINAWNDNGNSNQQFRVFGNNAQMVYWNHQGYIGGPYYPDVTNCTNVQPNFTGLLFPDPCVEDIHQDPPPSFELRESVIGSIVRGDLQYNFDNGVLFERSAREFAYEALKANENWLNTSIDDSVYSEFNHIMFHSNLGKFKQFDDIISGAYDSISGNIRLTSGIILNLSGLLASITPSDQYETEKLYLYNYYLDNKLFENDEQVTDSLVSIIAYSNPLEKGDIVYMARAFMHIIVDDENFSILRIGKPKNNHIVAKDLNVTNFKIFPNPANEVITLKMDSISNYHNYTFRITDILGNIKREFFCTTAESVFNISNLQNGIYYYEIFDGQNIINRGKICISK